jgi:hypothetical protein
MGTPALVGHQNGLTIAHQVEEQAGRTPKQVGKVRISGLINLHGQGIGTCLQMGGDVKAVNELVVRKAAGRATANEPAVDPQLIATIGGYI